MFKPIFERIFITSLTTNHGIRLPCSQP